MGIHKPFGKIKLRPGPLAVWVCGGGIGLAVMVDGLAVQYRVIEIRLVP